MYQEELFTFVKYTCFYLYEYKGKVSIDDSYGTTYRKVCKT